MIKYLGSKRLLTQLIVGAIEAIQPNGTVLDLFSGTSRVGCALKQASFRVLANDHNAYAATLARAYIQSDLEDWLERATDLIDELNQLAPDPGYFTETFCIKSRFFKPENGARVDAIRESIAQRDLEPELEAIALVSLMEAADRVDSTTGVQMAYLKQWASRAHKPLHLRVPKLLPRAASGKGAASCLDAIEAAKKLTADIVYIDPPYNQHSYLSNYHIWESLVRWDKPPVYGVACKRVDCRKRKSPYNSKRQCLDAMRLLLESLDCKAFVVSFSNEGYLSRTVMEQLLEGFGDLRVIESDYKRYVGAQIGIHNPAGEKVGRVSHLRNKEFLYVVGPSEVIAAVDQARPVGGETHIVA